MHAIILTCWQSLLLFNVSTRRLWPLLSRFTTTPWGSYCGYCNSPNDHLWPIANSSMARWGFCKAPRFFSSFLSLLHSNRVRMSPLALFTVLQLQLPMCTYIKKHTAEQGERFSSKPLSLLLRGQLRNISERTLPPSFVWGASSVSLGGSLMGRRSNVRFVYINRENGEGPEGREWTCFAMATRNVR